MNQISLCIIAKNEQHNIEKCLSAIHKYPFEIIVVDTGSSDNTKKIASSYTDKVFDFNWDNDFAAARNFSLAKAANDWVLILDCDETVLSLDYDALIQFTLDHPAAIGRIERHSTDHGGLTTIDYVERLFNKKIYHYEGIIHEQVCRIDGTPDQCISIPIQVNHSGYSTLEIATQKSERNLSLLFQALQLKPDDPYLLFQIGQCYFMVNNYEKALIYFDQALNYDLDPKAEYVQLLIISYGYTLIHTGHAMEAIEILKQLETEFSFLADYHFLLGCCYMRTNEPISAVSCFVKALTTSKFNAWGVNSHLALYNLGLLYEDLGETKMAQDFFRRASNDYEPALAALSK